MPSILTPNQGVPYPDYAMLPDVSTDLHAAIIPLEARSVMRFTNAADRTAKLTGNYPVVDGMVSYLQDTDVLEVRANGAWKTIGTLYSGSQVNVLAADAIAMTAAPSAWPIGVSVMPMATIVAGQPGTCLVVKSDADSIMRIRTEDISGRQLLETWNGTAWTYGGLPYAMAAGSVGVPLTADVYQPKVINFPPGRFTQPPVVTTTAIQSMTYYSSVGGVDKDKCTIYAGHKNDVATTATVNVYWQAIQMRYNAGAG